MNQERRRVSSANSKELLSHVSAPMPQETPILVVPTLKSTNGTVTLLVSLILNTEKVSLVPSTGLTERFSQVAKMDVSSLLMTKNSKPCKNSNSIH
jgi:hypothetical protein